MPISLAIIMLGMGMSLIMDHFRQVLISPTAFLIGCINQMLLVPLIAFCLTFILNLDPMYALGIMLIAACPGGPATNLITFLSNGNLALSISLTSIDGLITMISLPVIISLSLAYFLPESQSVDISISDTVLKVLLMTVLPVSLGMFIRKYYPSFAVKLLTYVKPLSAILYLIILILILVGNFDLILDSIAELGVPSILLNLSGMVLGWILASSFRLNIKDKIAIIIESGIQNGSLAIVVASSILYMPQLSLIAGIYSIIMFMTSGLVVFFFGWYRARLAE